MNTALNLTHKQSTAALAGSYIPSPTVQPAAILDAQLVTETASEYGDVSNSAFLCAIFDDLRHDEYLWTAAFTVSPERTGNAEWAGQQTTAEHCRDYLHGNAYFSVAALKPSGESLKRRKINFSRLHCIVLDDAADCELMPTWRLRTSPGKVQIGFRLSTPLEDAGVAERIHKALGEGGRIPADKSGNNPVRYVRLPSAINTKHTPPFACQLELFDPSIRHDLHDLLDALGLDVGYILSGQRSRSPLMPTSDGAARQTDAELVRQVMSKKSYHDPLLKLTARYARRGMDGRAIVDTIQGMMLAIDDRSERWKNRYDDVPRIVLGADKFRPASVADLSGIIEQLGGKAQSKDETPPEGDSGPPATPDRFAYPPPFRGVMHDVVTAALAVSIKPQPAISTLAALLGMAASCAGFYGLPSGMRLNLYGCGVAETGEGKEQPRSIATTLVKAAGAKLIGKPASGPGLEDCLTSRSGALISLDEIAHFFAAINNGKAPPHLIELAGLLLQLFSASRGEYHTRVKAVAAGTLPARTVYYPAVSLLGFATPEKLGEAMGVSNIEDGLLGRFLFAFGEASVIPRRITDWFQLPDSVAAAAKALREATPPMLLPAMLDNAALDCIPILIDPAAEARLTELLIEFDRQRQKARSAFAKALLARSCEKCERVAGVLAVWDSPRAPVMTLEHVEWSAQLLFASDAALLRFSGEYMHGGATQANAQKVLKLIKRAAAGEFQPQRPHEKGLVAKGVAPYSMVMRASKLSKRDLDDAVAHLVDLSEVLSGTLPSLHPNGRPEAIRVLTLKS
jgi:hypothetical protein